MLNEYPALCSSAGVHRGSWKLFKDVGCVTRMADKFGSDEACGQMDVYVFKAVFVSPKIKKYLS
jgi:hypothetical protein